MAEQFQRREVLRLAAAGAALACGGVRAQGSGWPTKPVTMVVPFPAGGGTDAFARPLSAQFGKVAGQTLVIDNRGGAGGTVGASIAAKGAPDGYMLFMGAVHHAIAPTDGDVVVRKSRVGAFSTTDLAEQLSARGIDTLILAGISTSGVVLSTVRDAADRDYRVVVLSDASADPDPEVHAFLLERIFPRQATITTTAALAQAFAR